MNFNFRRILFWIFAVICIVLLVWLIFGNSPTELFISSAVVILIIVKMWDINEKQIKIEMGTKNGFCNMGKDMKTIKQDISLVKQDAGLIKQDMNLIKKRMGILE